MNKFERIKDEKDGLDVWENLIRASTEGHEILDADDRMRLKWYGLYEHNTKDGYFMLRVKVTNGIMSADQTEVLAGITRDFGRGIIDCTTRQCVQIHWLRLHEIPELFDRLEKVGMTTSGACGDITRNIVGNTMAGIAADEITDGLAAAESLHEYFLDNKLYSNLPRKYKISVNGRPTAQGRGLINCISLVGAIHADGTHGFNVRVGGGLSSSPHLAKSIDIFASPEELPEVMGAVTAVYRDSEENRAKRGKARVKFLMDSIGPVVYREKVVAELGWDPRHDAPLSPESPDHDHIGVTVQKDGIHSAVGMCVRVGRLTADQLQELAVLSRKYSTQEEVRLTHQQNVLIPFIPNERVDAFLAEPLLQALQPNPAPFLRNTQSCTGMEYCGLAKIWTKGIVEGIVDRLDEKFADVNMGHDFRFHYAGCSSSCAQQQIGDIGIEGKLKRVDDQMVQAMDVRIGGRTNGHLEARFNEVILDRVPWWDLEPTLHKVIELYADHRATPEEGFRDFTNRVGFQWWHENLEPAGTPRPADAGAEMLPALV